MFRNKLTLTASTAALTASLLIPVSAFAAVPDYSSNISSLVSYLEANQGVDGGITGFGGETSWTIMGLSSVGIDPHTVQTGGVSLLDFLANNSPSNTTGWERDLLAVTAAGENPFTFGGRNYVASVQSFASSGQIGSTTALNDDAFGILALISAGPSANQTIISDSIDFLISNQSSDGGWSYAVGNVSDPDSTAVSVQALQTAQAKGFVNAGLDEAITDGVSYLSGSQQADGGWDAGFGTNAGSTAWSVLAVLGDDSAVTDGLNFITNKQDVSGGIDGGFGADTYTSANSLIAFGQKAFPIGSFDGVFEEPNDNQNPAPGDSQDNQSQPVNDEGQVLAATSQNGQVLASTLPETGILGQTDSTLPSREIVPEKTSWNFLLVFSLAAVILGLIARHILNRLEKYGKLEIKRYKRA